MGAIDEQLDAALRTILVESEPESKKAAKHRPVAGPILKYIARNALDAFHKTTGEAEFTKRGAEYYGHCPIHGDKRPSLRIDLEKKSWFCDPCGQGGGIVELYAAVHGLEIAGDFDRIERELAELFGVKLSATDIPKKSKVTELLDLLQAHNVQPFSDSNGNTYVDFVTLEGHRDTRRIVNFGRFCSFLYRRMTGKDISPATVQIALSHLDAEAAEAGGTPHDPALRYGAAKDGYIYVNLARRDRKILQLTRDGYSVIEYADCPVRFVFLNGMAEIPLPGTPMELDGIHRRFFSNMGDGAFLLLLGFIFSAMRAADEYPIFAIHDAPGCGKTELGKSLKLLIDPTSKSKQTRVFPRDQRDLFAALCNSYLPVWDNVSAISADASDALASIATGGGNSQRALYTNSDEVSLDGAHPVVLTSVPAIARRPDFADRVMNPALERFCDKGGTVPRVDVTRYRVDFMSALPDILATLYTAICGGLREIDSVELPESTRMADSARWMCACLKSLGKHEAFFTAYKEDRADTGARLLDETPLFALILGMVSDDRGFHSWSGTATQLLNQLNDEVPPHVARNPKWPKSSSHLSAQLAQLESAFRSAGVLIEHVKEGHNKTRIIQLRHLDADADAPQEPAQLRQVI